MSRVGFSAESQEFAMKHFVFTLIVLVGFAGRSFGQASDELPFTAFTDWSFNNNAGWRAISRNQFDVGERHFRAAIQAIRPYDANDPRLLAHSYNDVAWALHKQGRSREAQPLADWALKVREAKVGADAEATAQTLFVLGSIEAELGHLDLAETCFNKTLAIHQIRSGPNSANVISALIDLANVQAARRKFSQAQAAFNRVLNTPARFLNDNDPNRALAFAGLADIENVKGEIDKAIDHLRKAIAIYEQIPPSDPTTRPKLDQKLQELLKRQSNQTPKSSVTQDRSHRAKETASIFQPKRPKFDPKPA